MLNLFAASINISPLSGAETIFEQEGDQKFKRIKFHFAPKLPSICINQKCSMGVESLHIFYSLNLNGSLGAKPPAFGDFGDILPKESIFRMFQMKFCLNTFETLRPCA